ncbi:hypothetical protein VCRA2123E76_170005 [Vibrio crassostreae]|nr:hypothetical protein VCRA2123E76_170005 [Vibrio crassostreae]
MAVFSVTWLLLYVRYLSSAFSGESLAGCLLGVCIAEAMLIEVGKLSLSDCLLMTCLISNSSFKASMIAESLEEVFRDFLISLLPSKRCLCGFEI